MSRFYILILIFRGKQGGYIMIKGKSMDKKIAEIVKNGMVKVGDVVLINCSPRSEYRSER